MKKLGIILIGLLLCSSCAKEPEQKPVTRTKVKDGVYQDAKGNLYFKVLNPYRYDKPSKGKFRYLQVVYLDEKFVPLKNIVDLKSISRRHNEGMYFSDKNHVYVNIDVFMPPGQRRFSGEKTKTAKVFGQINSYLQTDRTYYYNGVPIFNLDIETAKYIVWQFPNSKEKLEIVKDKTGYFFERHKLTLEFLCRINFTNKEKTAIIRGLLGMKNGKATDCKK